MDILILIRQIFEGQDIQHLPRIFTIVDIQVQLVHPAKHSVSMEIHGTKHTLIHCADPMTDLMLFFRHYPQGLLPALKRSTQLGQAYVSSSSMYAWLSAWTYKRHCLFITLILPWIICLHQVYKDRNIVRQLVKRAEMAGFKAIALTVDTPILGRREADIKNRC